MLELEMLYKRIVQRTTINLRELEFDVNAYLQNLIPLNQLKKFYAFYGITQNHPIDFQFRHSSLAGSYFLGKCQVTNSLLYKSDIRGDELKKKGDTFQFQKFKIPIKRDETIDIQNSMLIKTLVHNFSHNPETPEFFGIRDCVSLHYANIHGSPSHGCFLEPFSTVDLTTMSDCIIGTYSYLQTPEIKHLYVKPGTVWVRNPDDFNFLYRFPPERLSDYISFSPGKQPRGIFMDFVGKRKKDFQQVFETLNKESSVFVPDNASLDRYAVTKPEIHISDNVLVSQRAFLQNAWLGKGANAQENCYIINSRLEGYNVTAHGAKIIESELGEHVFVGFNSFLRGRPYGRLKVGKGCIVMPHTIIDINYHLTIPDDHLVWGLIRNENDLEINTLPIKEFKKINTGMFRDRMVFEGSGANFIKAFKDRIQHILEANGAFFDGKKYKGHAQYNQNLSFNTIQPYPEGDLEGLYPTIIIQP